MSRHQNNFQFLDRPITANVAGKYQSLLYMSFYAKKTLSDHRFVSKGRGHQAVSHKDFTQYVININRLPVIGNTMTIAKSLVNGIPSLLPLIRRRKWKPTTRQRWNPARMWLLSRGPAMRSSLSWSQAIRRSCPASIWARKRTSLAYRRVDRDKKQENACVIYIAQAEETETVLFINEDLVENPLITLLKNPDNEWPPAGAHLSDLLIYKIIIAKIPQSDRDARWRNVFQIAGHIIQKRPNMGAQWENRAGRDYFVTQMRKHAIQSSIGMASWEQGFKVERKWKMENLFYLTQGPSLKKKKIRLRIFHASRRKQNTGLRNMYLKICAWYNNT